MWYNSNKCNELGCYKLHVISIITIISSVRVHLSTRQKTDKYRVFGCVCYMMILFHYIKRWYEANTINMLIDGIDEILITSCRVSSARQFDFLTAVISSPPSNKYLQESQLKTIPCIRAIRAKRFHFFSRHATTSSNKLHKDCSLTSKKRFAALYCYRWLHVLIIQL